MPHRTKEDVDLDIKMKNKKWILGMPILAGKDSVYATIKI